MLFQIDQKPAGAAALRSDTGLVITYGELCRLAREVGRAAGAGSLVFCLCRNVPGAAVGYLGLISTGSVPLLLDAHIAPALLAGLLETYRPTHIWAPEDRTGLPDGLTAVYSSCGYRLLATGHTPCALHPDLALLLTTSGSTGSPKLVRQTRANMEANAASICQYLGLTERERPITTLPLNYTYGLSILNSHLLAGAQLLMTEHSLVQQPFWDFFEREQATSFGGVPYTYEMLHRLRFTRMELPTLTSMTQAGGKLPEALHREFGQWAADHGVRFFVMYGQSEATARMSYLPPERTLEKCGSIGVAIPGGRFALSDGDGGWIEEPDQAGELVYTGPNVTMGYAACREDLAKGDERGGVLYTGDIARRDADGYYYVVGRKKRFVKLFGNRVSLDACEQLLKQEYPDCDCACAGRDEALCIYLTDPALTETARLRLAELTGLNQKAFRALWVEAIPKNEAGKTLYTQLPAPEEV